MKAKEIAALESYIKTGNEYLNEFTFEMLCDVLQQGQFENPETPLRLFSNAIDTFIDEHEHPVKAMQAFTGELDKQKLNPAQMLFVYEWVCKYLRETTYKELNLEPINDLLNSKKKKLKAEQPEKPLTKDIRQSLKDLMQKELENLPETLKTLEPIQRLNILCKLMPFVLPKVESVTHQLGEPGENSFV